jgi:hypothetical protein
MDIKQLLEKMEEFAGEKVGQKPGEQWRGTDKGTPGKKLVGASESVLKDLSKGPTAKTKEQELAEEWANFNEEDLGTHPKRARRTSDRHSRGHEPQARYKTVKADEGSENPHPASKDPIVAKVVKQMRPGLTGLNMGNEAFLYFAYELGKQRARDVWEDYLPAIRDAYEKGLNEDANTDNKLAKLLTRFINQNEGADRAVAADAIEYIRKLGHIEQFATSLDYFAVDLDESSEGDDSVEARWMVKVSDDEGDHLKTYHRKFPNLSAAKKAYKNTPYATDFKYKPVKKDQVEEAIVGQDSFNRAGYNPISDESDYLKKLSDLSNLSRKPGLDQQMKDQIKQRILDLNAEARKKGYIQAESRGHNVIATKLKNLERERKFASGELKIPTPQERQAQLAKQQPKKEKVDEYGADNPAQATTQKASPAQAQQVAANLNTQKTALSQLKQINPEIDPQKAAMAVTKDVATMSPQEKEELAQVAKTLSPALGTPALGSIKTAIQKSQLQAKK